MFLSDANLDDSNSKSPFRKKKHRGQHSNQCYLCNQPGYFAKNCPNKPKQSTKMLQQLSQLTNLDFSYEDVESLFSVDDEPTSDIVFHFAASDTDPSLSDSNSNDYHYSYQIQNISQAIPSIALLITLF